MRRLLASVLVAGSLAVGGVVATAAPAEAAGHNSCRPYVLRQGSSGYCTRMAQTLLRGPWGHSTQVYSYQLATDGDFGPKTTAAVQRWQRISHHLSVDGVIGPKTWKSLCSIGMGGDGALNATYLKVYNAAFVATC